MGGRGEEDGMYHLVLKTGAAYVDYILAFRAFGKTFNGGRKGYFSQAKPGVELSL